jgi:methionine-rich copper-binding protein CopC
MRPRQSVLLVICLFAGTCLFFTAGRAVAHAILLESTPAANSSVVGPDIPIKLRFNVRIDATRSRITLVRPDASVQTLVISKGTSADILASQARGLTPGEYRIRWQALASDGHITRGEIPFQAARP